MGIYLKLFADSLEKYRKLSDAEFGRLMRAALNYKSMGVEKDAEASLKGREKLLWDGIKLEIDRDNGAYSRKVAANRENGKLGGRPKSKKNTEGFTEIQDNPNDTEGFTETQDNPNNPVGFTETQKTQIAQDKDKDKDKEEKTPSCPIASDGGGEENSETRPNAKENMAKTRPPPLWEQRFDEFWTVYPKKQGKGAALKAWRKIKPDEGLFAKMLHAVKAAKETEQWRRENGRFIPNPATWLNQERWDDEPTQTGGDAAGSMECNTGKESKFAKYSNPI